MILVAFLVTLPWSNGQSCDEDSSLLQGRVQMPHLEGHATDPVALLESVQKVAHRLTREPPESSDEAIYAINSVRAALSQMKPYLEEEHLHVQEQIQRQLDEINACHNSASHGATVTEDVADQIGVMNQCFTDQTTATETQELRCREWSNHASHLVFPATNIHASSTPEEVFEIAQNLKDWVDDAWPVIASERSACNEATAFATEESERCAPVVAEYDQTFCQQHLSCNLLRACHDHEVAVYRSLEEDSGVGMEARQDQYRTINQVECLVSLITEALSTNTAIHEASLGSCDGNVDVASVTLSFPAFEPAPLSSCPIAQAGDPECPEIELPSAWTSGEPIETLPLQAPHQDILVQHQGILVDVPSCTGPQVVADDVPFPEYESFTLDFYVTEYEACETNNYWRQYLATHWGYPVEGWQHQGWALMSKHPPPGYAGWNVPGRHPGYIEWFLLAGPTSGWRSTSFYTGHIPYGTEYRVTVTYDSTTHEATAYLDGVLAEPKTGHQNPKTQEVHCASCGSNLDPANTGFCIGSEGDPTAPWHDMAGNPRRPVCGQLRDFTFSRGVHPP